MELLNKVVIATPRLLDPTFARSMVLVVEHTDESSSGIVLNGKHCGHVGFGSISHQDMVDQEVISEWDAEDVDHDKFREYMLNKLSNGELSNCPLYYGGPNREDALYFVHGYQQIAEAEFTAQERMSYKGMIPPSSMPTGSSEIIDGLWFGCPPVFIRIVEKGIEKRPRFKFLSGTVGWYPGQLEAEVRDGIWRIVDFNPDWMFDREQAEAQLPKKFDPSMN